jgi:DNA-binding NarL/FixJ family response regulator
MGAVAERIIMSRLLRPRVLLADDHRVVAEGLKSLLSAEFELVGVVEDGRALIEAARALRPDVIVADITMPRLNGIDALVRLRQDGERVPVVFLTMHPDLAYARRALEAGASGYVLKHAASSELIAAIRAALDGKIWLTPALAGKVLQDIKRQPDKLSDPVASLTPRQREILQLLAEGLSAKEISAMLGVSARTVEFHKYQMMERLDLHTSAELVHFAIKHGIVEI